MESALLDDSRRTILSKNRRPALVAIAVIVVCGIAQQAIGQNGQIRFGVQDKRASMVSVRAT